MKKFFIAIVALAAAVACSNDDIISIDRQTIGFGNPFVENATRAAIDGSYSGTKELASFKVWGTVSSTTLSGTQNTVNIFNDVEVFGEIGDAVWGYSDQYIQYWAPSCNYNFTAIADYTTVTPGANNMPSTITYNDNTTQQGDLLLATATATTDINSTPSQSPVAFTFIHLLAKAYFTFNNTITTNSRYTFNVKDIKFLDVKKQGTYNIANNTWGSQTVEGELNFGNSESAIANGKSAESNNARTFVPATYTDSDPLTVQFTVEMLLDGTAISSVTHTKTVAREFAKNTQYNFIVDLGASNKITFTVTEIDGWDSKVDISIP